jgi:hypothetical protein
MRRHDTGVTSMVMGCNADAGVAVVIPFSGALTNEQQRWLQTTNLPLRSVSFHRSDCFLMLPPVTTLSRHVLLPQGSVRPYVQAVYMAMQTMMVLLRGLEDAVPYTTAIGCVLIYDAS